MSCTATAIFALLGPLLLATTPAPAATNGREAPPSRTHFLRGSGNATAAPRDLEQVLLWSGAQCGARCVVPAGETWILDESATLETLTIQGTLQWDTTKEGLELRAGYVLVEDGGHFKLGTPDAPMQLRATIHISKGPHTHPQLGKRFFGGVGSARIDIHGRRLARTWSLLSHTAGAGATEIRLKHDPETMGWRVGDRIGIATTSRGESTEHTIVHIGAGAVPDTRCSVLPDVKTTCSADGCRVLAGGMTGRTCDDYCAASGMACGSAAEEVSNDCDVMQALGCDQPYPGTSDLICECLPPTTSSPAPGQAGPVVLRLSGPLRAEHWGGHREIYGRRLELAAEVVNLERNILITGDHDDIEATGEGLHTVVTGSGYWDMRYARVEHCGQRPVLGRYCLHFHLMGQCPECVLQGNAVVGSQHVGITVHGSHRTLVDQNVVWDARGIGMYTEDGNEMHNTFSDNAVICTWWQRCSVRWARGGPSVTAGIFLIGMTNNLIGNHVVGHENAIWTPGVSAGNGRGEAAGRICPAFAPFGEIRGNVNHDCHRFGLYLDNQYPRNLRRDENGYLTDAASCDEFTASGQDNGAVNEVRDELDWHNMFVGHYALGDIQFLNFTSVNNAHSLYWKTSKNFADGRKWHIRDSAFLNDPSDSYGVLRILGPAGPFTFGLKNCVVAGAVRGGCGGICAAQHCGQGGAGGPCNVQYLLHNVDTSNVQGGPRIFFGVPGNSEDDSFVTPVFLALDASLGDYRSIASPHLNGFGAVGCQQLGPEWGSGHGCSFALRRLNVWGADSGRLRLAGPGYDVAAEWGSPVGGRNAGEMYYDSQHGGYGAPVVAGGAYVLSRVGAGMVVEFSDRVLADHFGGDDTLELRVGGASCQLRASDGRLFLSPMGRMSPWGSPFRALPTHTRIDAGTLHCGSPMPEPTPAPTPALPAPTATVSETVTAITTATSTLTSTPETITSTTTRASAPALPAPTATTSETVTASTTATRTLTSAPETITSTTTRTSAPGTQPPGACPPWVGRSSGLCVTGDPSIHEGACYDPGNDQATVQCIGPSAFDTYTCPGHLPAKCSYADTPPAPSPSPSTPCYNALANVAEDEGGSAGTAALTSIDACMAACTATDACNSFTACPQYGSCFLKDLVVTPDVAQKVNADCRTYYAEPCR